MAAYTSVATGNWNISTTWNADTAWAADTEIALNEFRTPVTPTGYRYECTARAGDFKTHATDEPVWPTTVGNTVVDDQITWTCRAGYPDTAADTATISAGHTVTYNVSSDVELGQPTIAGTFYVHRGMNTKMTLGHQDINLAATGIFDAGQTGDLIGSGYTAEFLWNTTSDNAKGFNGTSGCAVYSLGNPAYYRSEGANV